MSFWQGQDPAQPNPWWAGAVQAYLHAPSAGLSNAYLGQVELTPLPRGSYVSVSVPVAPWIANIVRSPIAGDVRLRLAVNTPATAPAVLIDHLRFTTP